MFLFITYLLLFVIVVYFSIKCAYYIDKIESKTNLSGMFLSGIILATIGALPEFVTSITAISFLHNPQMVLGNVLGSNIFNLTIMASLIIFFIRTFYTSKIDPRHEKTIYLLIIIYVWMLIKAQFNWTIAFWNIDLLSILIAILYILSIKYMSSIDTDIEDKYKEKFDAIEKVEDEEPIRLLVLKFITSSIILVISSIFITFATDKIAAMMNIGSTMAGAIFLAIVTSVPELAICITLCKLGNFNAMIGNMVGSKMFNFIILTLGDVIYTKGSIYMIDQESYKLTILGLLAVILTLIILKAKNKSIGISVPRYNYILPSVYIIFSYALFLFL